MCVICHDMNYRSNIFFFFLVNLRRFCLKIGNCGTNMCFHALIFSVAVISSFFLALLTFLQNLWLVTSNFFSKMSQHSIFFSYFPGLDISRHEETPLENAFDFFSNGYSNRIQYGNCYGGKQFEMNKKL